MLRKDRTATERKMILSILPQAENSCLFYYEAELCFYGYLLVYPFRTDYIISIFLIMSGTFWELIMKK